MKKTATLGFGAADVERERATRHFAEFVRQAWPIIEPGAPYLPNWHIELIGEYLEAVSAGEINRLIINLPPRYGKSILVSVLWPLWEWTSHPEWRYLFCSYSASLSVKHSLDRRRVLESEWYRAFWPQVVLTSDQNQKSEYENSARGVMVATSVGGTVTGKGGNRIILDDPIDPGRAASETERSTANAFFDQTLSTRLDDKKRDGAIVIVGQRVHLDDLSGHVLERSGESWTHLRLPASEERRTVVTFPGSGREVVREPGQPLWEVREGATELARARRELGSADYAAQYQQDPAPPEGALIRSEWWRHYRSLPEGFDEMLQSWDMAFKDTRSSDFVVGQVWGRRGSKIYLLDQVRGQWDIGRTINHMVELSRRWPAALLKLVEDKANGPAIIQLLNGRMPGIVAISPKDSKVARAVAVAPAIEAGNVHLPDPRFIPNSEWIEEFALEFSRFPRGSHDDQVDAATQALVRLVASSQSGGISIGIINGRGGRPGNRTYGGSNLPNPGYASPFAASNLPHPESASAWGGSNLPGRGAERRLPHVF